MKAIFISISIFSLGLLSIACGSDTASNSLTTKTNQQNGSAISANPANAGVNSSDSIAQGIPANPAVSVQDPNAAATTADGNAAPVPVPTIRDEDLSPIQRARKERLEMMKRLDKGNPNAPVKSTPIEAPDDSEFTASLTNVGTETRVFKSHGELSKVVRVTDGKKKTLKVYMKNGKVVDLPADKIGNLATTSAADILSAAGGAAPAMMKKPTMMKKPE